MGLSIDDNVKQKLLDSLAEEPTMVVSLNAWEQANETFRREYEARLKADMVAMLTEIQLEIEEHKMTSGVTNQGTWNECIACCSRIIQLKINALKENEK